MQTKGRGFGTNVSAMHERGRLYARLGLHPKAELRGRPADFGISMFKQALESPSMSSSVAFPQTLADQYYLYKYNHNIFSTM